MPLVIDLPNLPQTLAHQKRSIGTLRGNLGDYTSLNLENFLNVEAGKKLRELVDPFSYFPRITQPKLIGLSTNDSYWATDALNIYLKDIKGPTWIYYSPNTDHWIDNNGLEGMGTFTEMVMSDQKIPRIYWNKTDAGLQVWCDAPNATAMHWSAISDNRDFVKSKWIASKLETQDMQGKWLMPTATPEKGYSAGYVELTIPTGEKQKKLRFCTPILITPQTYPYDTKNLPPYPKNNNIE